MVEPDSSFNQKFKFWVIYDPMVTEQENLNFRYFSYLCIIGVTKHDGIYTYLVKAVIKTQYQQL